MTARTLTLDKEGHKYLIRYRSGCEQQAVDEVMRLAEDERTNLDWLDAATLSFQVARYAAMDCRRALSAPPARPEPDRRT